MNDLSLGLLTVRFLRLPFRQSRPTPIEAPANDPKSSPTAPLKDGLLDGLAEDFESRSELIEKS